eukprot:11214444-Lingulodinium_polyedra.AAC.1
MAYERFVKAFRSAASDEGLAARVPRTLGRPPWACTAPEGEEDAARADAARPAEVVLEPDGAAAGDDDVDVELVDQ